MSSDSRPARLDRRAILTEALRLVDQDGAESLSMRRLALALGAGTMSLYGHVSGREDLLDGLAEVMVDRIGMRFGEEPEAALRRLARGIRQVAHDHPAAYQLVGMRPLRTSSALGVVDAGLGALRALGLDDAGAVSAYRVLVSYVRGFALGEIASFTLEEPPRSMPEESRYPHVQELASELASGDRDAAFELGVDLLVAGFVRMGAD